MTASIRNPNSLFFLLVILIAGIQTGCFATHSTSPYIAESEFERRSSWNNSQVCENDPYCALFFAMLSLLPGPVDEGVTCTGQVNDEEENPVPNSVMVFKRKDWNGNWRISVLSLDQTGNFSFHIDPGSRDWEIAILGKNLGGIQKIFGESTSCPPFHFVVKALKDPEEIESFREKQLEPYIRSLLSSPLGNISEADQKKLLSFLSTPKK
jgi:hypothetical protein